MSAVLSSIIDKQGELGKQKRPRRSGYTSAKKGQRIAPPSHSASVRLPTALWERLEQEAGKAGVTRNRLIRELCEQGLQHVAEGD